MLHAGWKESEAVFTDALSKLLTSGPASSASSKAQQDSRQQAASRRMLASSTHTINQPDAAAKLLQQAEQDQSGQHNVHSMADSNQQAQHSIHGIVAIPADLPPAAGWNLTDQLPAASAPGSCPAADDTTVCTDEHQPAWEVPTWQQHSDVSSPNVQLELQQCQLLNASICAPSVQMTKEGKRIIVVVYNSLAWERATEPVRVPVSMPSDVTTHWLVTGVLLGSHSKPSCWQFYKCYQYARKPYTKIPSVGCYYIQIKCVKAPHALLSGHSYLVAQIDNTMACCAGPDGKPVQAQVVPVSNTTKELQDLMQAEGIVPNLEAAAAHELVFLAHLPPLG